MGEITLKALVGGTAAFLAWILMEPTKPSNPIEWTSFELRLILVMGMLVGLLLGGLSGWFRGSRMHAVRGALLGAVLCPMGIGLGRTCGVFLAATIAGPNWQYAPIPILVLGRTLAIASMGTGLGAGLGVSSLVMRRIGVGALGGLLGGLLSGATFDLVGALFQPFTALGGGGDQLVETGSLSRAMTAILVGSFVGLFIGIVERATRTAWLRLSLGRNEGKEWALDAPQNWIGRNEMAQVPLFGDPAVAPAHAVIVRQGSAYFIQDAGSPAGTLVNGQRIQASPLSNGAQIQIGGFVLQFQERVGRAMTPQLATNGPPVAPPIAPVAVPVIPPAAGATAAWSTGGYSLLAVAGPLTGQRFPVSGRLEAGREAPGLALAFDGSASRHHATFEPTASGVLVSDLASKNGTLVNGTPVSRATLQRGDTVQIGVSIFRIE